MRPVVCSGDDDGTTALLRALLATTTLLILLPTGRAASLAARLLRSLMLMLLLMMMALLTVTVLLLLMLMMMLFLLLDVLCGTRLPSTKASRHCVLSAGPYDRTRTTPKPRCTSRSGLPSASTKSAEPLCTFAAQVIASLSPLCCWC